MWEAGGGEGGHGWGGGVRAEVGVGGKMDVGAEGGEEGYWKKGGSLARTFLSF